MNNKKLEIVSGDGSNIDMSSVEVHINSLKPKMNNTKKKIIVPKTKKD